MRQSFAVAFEDVLASAIRHEEIESNRDITICEFLIRSYRLINELLKPRYVYRVASKRMLPRRGAQ
jgi:hypothetical protein